MPTSNPYTHHTSIPPLHPNRPIWALFHESHRPELMKSVRAVIMDADTPGRIRARLRSAPQPPAAAGGGGDEAVVAMEYDISLRHSQTGIVCYMRPNDGPAEGDEGAGGGAGGALAGEGVGGVMRGAAVAAATGAVLGPTKAPA